MSRANKHNLKKRNSRKKELESIQAIYTKNIKDEAIRFRIEHILDWYIRKSTFYKNTFYIFSVLVIIINTSIPIINQYEFDFQSKLVSIISGAASVLTSLTALFTMKDTWFRYRKHAELIKSECMMFNCRYNEYNSENREYILAKNVEDIINDERKDWEHNKFNAEDDSSNLKL